MPSEQVMVQTEDVIKFFEEEIDGMGKKDGIPRNQDVPNSIRQSKSWQFCNLSEDEFKRLIIPDDTKMLIKDKGKNTLSGFVKKNVEERLALLESGADLPPLIVRELLLGDPKNGSFYIEDGAKRAIAYKLFFDKHPYKAVRSYVGRGRT